MLDCEVKIGDGFDIVLCDRVSIALRVGPFDPTGTGFIVRATAMNEEGRRCVCL